jgi:hypothetical protein
MTKKKTLAFCPNCHMPFKPFYGHQKFCCFECAFWSRVDIGQPKQCWEWQGSKHQFGYGEFRWHNKLYRAHVVCYQIQNGKLLKGEQVLHHCDSPPCCNPYHLFVGTQADNIHDMDKKGRRNNGTPPRGEKHPLSKLTKNDVFAIRELCGKEKLTQREIARKFNVCQGTINAIHQRRLWGHI